MSTVLRETTADRWPRVESLEWRTLLAFAPAGEEFRVNESVAGEQEVSYVASDGDGSFVVVWTGASTEAGVVGPDIFARRYDAAGSPLGGEFRVNTYTASYQEARGVAVDADGDFVVVWESLGQGGDNRWAVYFQRYDASGRPVGPETRASSFGPMASTARRGGSVAMDAAGNFAVAWHFTTGDGFGSDVYVRRFNGAGGALDDDRRVNPPWNTYGFNAQVAMDPDGDYVVCWDTAFEVLAQRFDSTAMARGPTLVVNTSVVGRQGVADVSVDAAGNFVVAWTKYVDRNGSGGDGSGDGVFARRFAADGTPAGDEFQVNTHVARDQWAGRVAVAPDGHHVIVWSSRGQDGDGEGVYARRYAPDGSPDGAEFRVNTVTASDQGYPDVAADGGGGFLVTWTGGGDQDGSGDGIYAQRYAANRPPVAHGLPPLGVRQDAPDTVLSMWDAFDDPDGAGDAALTFEVVGNTDGSLFADIVVDNAAGTLTLDYAAGVSGSSTLTVRATDPAGLSAESSFVVTIRPADDYVPGDANGDDVVDVADLGILATNYGQDVGEAGAARGDFNGDRVVDVADLGILATQYGRRRAAAASTSAAPPQRAPVRRQLTFAGLRRPQSR